MHLERERAKKKGRVDIGKSFYHSSLVIHHTYTQKTTRLTYLEGNGVRKTEFGSPVSTANGNKRNLRNGDGSTNSGRDLLGALDSKTDMSVVVSDSNKGLEAGALSGAGLLLNGHDLHDLVLESSVLSGGEEVVDDLFLLDGDGVEEDFLHVLDLSGLDQSSELGHGDPLLLSVTSTSASTSTSAPSSASTSTSASSSASTSKTSTICRMQQAVRDVKS